MIHVFGGVYYERCQVATYAQVMGSGARGAATLRSLGIEDVTLITCGSDVSTEVARNVGDSYGFQVEVTPVPEAYTFDYPHLAASPSLFPGPPSTRTPMLEVKATSALVFGMVEGDAVVRSAQLVYDPQSPGHPEFHSPSRIQADELAYVLNLQEGRSLSGESKHEDIGSAILRHSGAAVVVLKCGPDGGWVYSPSQPPTQFPAFRTERTWPIGSGDVFSSAFMFSWSDGQSPLEAAVFASRATALYCRNRSLPASEQVNTASLEVAPASRGDELIYLAGPFFTSAQIRFINDIRDALFSVGVRVFSPLHDVGLGPSERVAPRDIEGLSKATAVLALIDGADPGTLFEVGYARSLDLPVVALAENVAASDLTMFVGSGCLVVGDPATAVYQAIWASR